MQKHTEKTGYGNYLLGVQMFDLLKILLVFSIALIGVTAVAAPANIVPKPNKIIWGKDTFTLQATTRIIADKESRAVAELAASYLRSASGFSLNIEVVKNPPLSSNAMTLKVVKDASLNREAYLLQVSKDGVLIQGASSVGLFYGVQTLRQLFPVEMFSERPIERRWSLPTCRIKDAPTFSWRGMMLDVSRYWFTKEYLFKYLDIMAAHKMNMLHLHLIDDCGWRLEIKAYPKLTEIGGFRGEGAKRYGGFYTQDDIREIIAYAEVRGITIVPEIELPAHTLSALVAYPELSCTGAKMSIPSRHFISKDLYCAGKPSTWVFLKKVLDEVADLFPGEYIHVGGDEAKYDRWRNCKDCQGKMKELGLTKEKELQGWMTCEVENHLATKGKRIIGWDEIMACGVSDRAGIMPWHNPAAGTKGALQGNPVVMSLTKHCYFDTVESKHPGEPPGAGWLKPISLKQAYKWDPMPKGLNNEAAKNILGASGCVWTDMFLHKAHILADHPGEGTVRSENYVEYLSMPRMAALAEVTWTPASLRSWGDFSQRMQSMYARYSHSKWNYRLPIPEVEKTDAGGGRTRLTLKSPTEGGSIYYTINGETPTAESTHYTDPVVVNDIGSFQAVAVGVGGAPTSLPFFVKSDIPMALRKYGTKIGTWSTVKMKSGEHQEIVLDATGLIDRNADYIVTFIYTTGKHGLDIGGIKVLRNGETVSDQDIHHGFAGANSRDNSYRINIGNYETGARFEIIADIGDKFGNDSNGLVFMRRVKPAKGSQ